MAYLPAHVKTQTQAQKSEDIVLSSSFLQMASYDPENYALTLHFKSRHWIVYRYFFPMTLEQFKLAPSHGSFYATQIKGKYPSITIHAPVRVSDVRGKRAANSN